MKIGVFNDRLFEFLNDRYAEVEEELKGKEIQWVKFSKDNFDRDIDLDVDALVLHRITKSQLDQLEQLKYIFIPFTGMDRFDLDYMKERGIRIVNAHAHAKFIAERGMALTMTLLGRIKDHDGALQKDIWYRGDKAGQWTSLFDKNIGIYGYGHIGKAYEKMVRPYTDHIHIIDRGHMDSLTLEKNGLSGHKDLESLASASDILFIGAPLTDQTRGSIDQHILTKMKDGFIINVARGPIVKQEDLIESLEDKTIGGYASDVWYNYPKDYDKPCQVTDQPIGHYSNVVLSPHNGWNTDIQGSLIENELFDNIIGTCRS